MKRLKTDDADNVRLLLGNNCAGSCCGMRWCSVCYPPIFEANKGTGDKVMAEWIAMTSAWLSLPIITYILWRVLK